MTEKLRINEWAEEDRPREKMMCQGASSLSNAELLAILIGSGSNEESAVSLMRKVLDGYNNCLGDLSKATIDELCSYKGIGPVKAITLLAASELGKRRKDEAPRERQQIRNSEHIYHYFYPLIR